MGVIFGIFTWVPITPDTVNQQIISWLKILRCPFLLSQSEFSLSLVHSKYVHTLSQVNSKSQVYSFPPQ